MLPTTIARGSGLTAGIDHLQSGVGGSSDFAGRVSRTGLQERGISFFGKFLTRIIRFGAPNEPFCSHPP
jgi:hypothetical protein